MCTLRRTYMRNLRKTIDELRGTSHVCDLEAVIKHIRIDYLGKDFNSKKYLSQHQIKCVTFCQLYDVVPVEF